MAVGIQLALIAVLLGINALLAGSEVALISLREAQIARLEERGARGRAVATLARDPNRFLATIQIGITLSGFLASATAAVSLAEPLVPLLDTLGAAARPLAVVLVTAVLTFVTLVLGELAPKRIAMQRAEGWALAAGGVLVALARVSGPAVSLLGVSTDLVVRLTGADPSQGRDAPTQEEVRDLIATGGLYDPEERRIITAPAGCMTPRSGASSPARSRRPSGCCARCCAPAGPSSPCGPTRPPGTRSVASSPAATAAHPSTRSGSTTPTASSA